MVAPSKLNEALQLVEALPAEDFVTLMEILKTREIEKWQEELALSAQESQIALERGELKPTSIEDLMKEARK